MPAAFYILFGWLLTAGTALSLGLLLMRRHGQPLSRGEHFTFSFVTGAALLSAAVMLCCVLHIVHKGVFLAAAAVSIGAAIHKRAWRRDWVEHAKLPQGWRMLLIAVYAVFGFIYFWNAMAPEYSPDGSTYHLGIVSRYYTEHGFVPIPTNMYASLTQGMEMLFLFAFAFGRHSAAALVHWTFLMALPVALVEYGRRQGKPGAGAFAAVLVFASPVFGVDGTSAYNDVAVACVVFVAFAAVRLGMWTDAAMLAGFAFAIKYTAFVAAPLTLAFARGRRAMLTVAAGVLVFAAPWLVRNIMYIGNPVAPFANSVFPNRFFYPDMERDYSREMRSYGGVRTAEIPVEATVRGTKLGGLLGPLFLLTPLALFAWKQREWRALLVAGAVYAALYPLNIGTRFLMPAAPFAALGLGYVVASWSGVGLALAAMHAVLSLPGVTNLYCEKDAWRLRDPLPVRAALRMVPEGTFLFAHSKPYLGARMMEDHVPAGAKVFTFGALAADAYTKREIVVGFQSGYGQRIRELLWTPLVREWSTPQRSEFRFAPRKARRVRLVQTGSSAGQVWTVNEVRVPAAVSHANARPNGWDAARVADGSVMTVWSSHEQLRPGQYVEVELAGEQMVERVEAISRRDQDRVALRLELDGQDAGSPAVTAEEPEIPRIREAARRQVVREGVRYLMVDEHDFGADDFLRRASEWGLRLLDSKGGLYLYELQ